jgi:glycosyltransferase involved in cell wall biosynthesis
VHCDTLYAAIACGIGLVGLGVPLIFHARVSRSGGVLDAMVPRLCTQIICVSRATAARFSASPPSKVQVIYNGVDLSAFLPVLKARAAREKLGIAPDAFVVGYAGQLLKAKGVESLIRAFARLRADSPAARLVIAGRGGDEGLLKAAAGDGVLFLPFSDSMPEFYAALDVFAFPTAHEEGLSRSLIESMACARPAVATPLGGNAETLVDGKTGFFVPVGDEAALCARLGALRLAPEERRRMGAAARRRAEELFDAAACAGAVETLYWQVSR